jgi:hypothetical protein
MPGDQIGKIDVGTERVGEAIEKIGSLAFI